MIKLIGTYLIGRLVRFGGISFLALVSFIRLRSDNNNLCPFFPQPKHWIPKFQVFVKVLNEHSDFATLQFHLCHPPLPVQNFASF